MCKCINCLINELTVNHRKMHQAPPPSPRNDGASLGPSDPSSAAAPASTRSPSTGPSSGFRIYKIVVLGDGGVGKSALTLQFVNHRFIDYHDPTIEDAYQRQVVIDGEPAALDILDTAGQVEFTAMRDQYMRCGEGFIICYSITERKSFEEALEYRKLIAKVRHTDEIPIVIVGNKFDLETARKVSQEEGQALARQYNCPFFETSAALRCYVDDVFHALVREIRIREKERLNVAQNNHLRSRRWKGLKNIFSVIFRRRRTE